MLGEAAKTPGEIWDKMRLSALTLLFHTAGPTLESAEGQKGRGTHRDLLTV